MTSSLFDSSYFGSTFGNTEVQKIFTDHGRIQSWLDVEAALARVQAKLGLIPISAAETITQVASVENLNFDNMVREYEKVGFPILPLVHELARCCDTESARWIHWGATTQDIVDTGLVLQMKSALAIISNQLQCCIKAVADLTEQHRLTVMAGRSFQQQAIPITFGFKTAVWLDELLKHNDRLVDIKKRALVCQLGGAVGTLATLGDDGMDVARGLAAELDLEVPIISWHTSRDGWAELLFWVSMVGSTLAKIANEVSLLMRTEVDEVREPYQTGKGGSSTMPQKRNPVACPIIIAIGNRLKETATCGLATMNQEHERGVAAMPLEWLTIPEAFILLSGSLKQSIPMLECLSVNSDQMRVNLESGGGLLMAEAVMMGIAPKLGRGNAHDLVFGIAKKARDSNSTLREALVSDERIRQCLSEYEIDNLLDPVNYLGSTTTMIDNVLEKYRNG